jgi:hypothetical protein
MEREASPTSGIANATKPITAKLIMIMVSCYFVMIIVAYFLCTSIVNSSLNFHVSTAITVITFRVSKDYLTGGIFKSRGYCKGFYWKGGRVAVGDDAGGYDASISDDTGRKRDRRNI